MGIANPCRKLDFCIPVWFYACRSNFQITTESAKARQYFNQGLRLLYGFNHGEAGRSFRAAIKADSTCAMAYWGMGMVLGPNYNAALNPGLLREIKRGNGQRGKICGKCIAHAGCKTVTSSLYRMLAV